MSRLIDADALIDGYKHMGYDPSEHPEESYMEGWCKGFNSAVDHCVHHAIHAPTIEPQPEQKYTNKELRVFMHGISMRLLSLRSAQHWKCDDETAEEIKFLERLYKKVESEVTQ